MLTYLMAFTLELASAGWQPPVPVLKEAIHFLAGPRVRKKTGVRYAKLVAKEARRRGIHGFLFLAFIHVETARKWDPKLHGATNDFGLMQVHVAENGSDRFLDREEELYIPAVNIREWGRLADMWRAHHQRSCGTRHPWWAHLKWGYRVKDVEHAMKVLRVFRTLMDRFGPRESVAWAPASVAWREVPHLVRLGF